MRIFRLSARPWVVFLFLVSGPTLSRAGAPVIDLADLPLEIQELIEIIEQAKTAIDQLETLIDTYEHWKDQAEKLSGRDGFKLRELKGFIEANQLDRFYQGPPRFRRLIQALDGEFGMDGLPGAYLDAFPKLRQAKDMVLGEFRIGGGFLRDTVEPNEMAFAMAEMGGVDALATMAESKDRLNANRAKYEDLFDRWSNPQHGEQEALDLIHLQLYQLNDLLIQEQSMFQGALNSEVSELGRQYQAVKTRTAQLEPLLAQLGRDAKDFRAPSGQELFLR